MIMQNFIVYFLNGSSEVVSESSLESVIINYPTAVNIQQGNIVWS